MDKILIDLTIIIPVYNSEKYIERCLDSILNQKVDIQNNFEIIIVDDFSKDESVNLINKYMMKYKNIKLYKHKKNKKLATARTTGMKKAKGEYIIHVDSDDILMDNSINRLINIIKEKKVDIILYDYEIENQNGKKLHKNRLLLKGIIEDKILLQKYFFGSAWTKAVKTELTKKLIYSSYPPPRQTEDLIYSTEILLKSNSIYVYPQILYKYFINNDSITNSTNALNHIKNQIIVGEKLKKIIEKYPCDKIFYKNLVEYYSKWIHLSIFKIRFINTIDLKLSEINKILNIDFINGTNLKNSYNSSVMNSVFIIKYFGLKFFISYFLKNIF